MQYAVLLRGGHKTRGRESHLVFGVSVTSISLPSSHHVSSGAQILRQKDQRNSVKTVTAETTAHAVRAGGGRGSSYTKQTPLCQGRNSVSRTLCRRDLLLIVGSTLGGERTSIQIFWFLRKTRSVLPPQHAPRTAPTAEQQQQRFQFHETYET